MIGTKFSATVRVLTRVDRDGLGGGQQRSSSDYVIASDYDPWNFVPLGARTLASNDEILRRFLLIRKLEGATLSDVHADFNQQYPSDKEDRNLSYVLFLRALDGNDLHSRTTSFGRR